MSHHSIKPARQVCQSALSASELNETILAARRRMAPRQNEAERRSATLGAREILVDWPGPFAVFETAVTASYKRQRQRNWQRDSMRRIRAKRKQPNPENN